MFHSFLFQNGVLISFKILFLLWSINAAPPILSLMMDKKWNMPLDCGVFFFDGKPLLGTHKTVRGIIGGCLTGGLIGYVLGFPLWIGLLSGLLSMSGDLLSSFIKRRFGNMEGTMFPGLDQTFEGLFPFVVLGPAYALSAKQIYVILIIFIGVAFLISWFVNKTLLTKPYESYHRSLNSKTRFRELRSSDGPFQVLFNIEQVILYSMFMKNIFRILGLYKKGMKNALNVRLNKITFYFKDLPESFDNYTILFMSDLHLDGLDGITERIQDVVKNLSVDLCIFGGDYRTNTYGYFSKTIWRLNHLLKKINSKDGIYAVLGNHDCLEMIPPLTKKGITFLNNESVKIERNGDKIWIAGIDDPCYYGAHDLQKTFRNIPEDAFTIFTAHAPEVYHEASQYKPKLYLCGHTHAGQIQLPLVGPVITYSKAPRKFSQGEWRYNGMLGYTSAGAGVSGIPVRFGCCGEVVHITFKKGSQPDE